MRTRVRTINRLGKNSYLTTSSSVGEHLLATIIYYILFYPYYLFFKWCLVKPIKYVVNKISKSVENNKENENE